MFGAVIGNFRERRERGSQAEGESFASGTGMPPRRRLQKDSKKNYHDICLDRAASLRWFAKNLGKRYIPTEGVINVI